MEQSSKYLTPPLLAKFFGSLPRYPGSFLFASGLNLVLARHLHPDTLAMLENKTLRIQAIDANLYFDYIWRNNAFRAANHGITTPDLTIKANVWDFYCLLQRNEDPDTLFFSRRLVIEGNTELGLMVKNTLDAIDMEVFSPKNVIHDLFTEFRPLKALHTKQQSF